MLFAVTKLYILYKIDKDLSLFFIVCGGGDGRWWAYGSCSTVPKCLLQPAGSMFWVRTQCLEKR